MITIVVTFNILLSALLLYVAWRVWLLKRSFARIKNTLMRASTNTHAVLGSAPNFLYTRQTTIKNLRSRNLQLESKFQQFAQVFSILLILSRWRRRTISTTSKN